ncbi:hypothetical protein MNBD_DELTA01-401 [hydrothermal vent metagenome]|uniref:Methylene-tetrahydrofolate reductase C-terminal-like domain-containing protein n=1 Tax=hydrothermal vent metagenome TaxID=652676 RepID=A0A3B0RN83_9ZZZZ
MIITKKKNPEDILKSIERTGAKKVHLVGCDTCAEQCRTGGITELKETAGLLEDNGYSVTGISLIDETCYNQLVRREFRKNDSIGESEAILVLACGAGVKTVTDNAKTNQPVLPALDSLFLASVERVGRFFQGCSLCGECVLEYTAGICPHTDCPKSLLNGPCGGVDSGKCEVLPDNDCAWVRIYNKLKEQDRLELMKETIPAKDHSVAQHPAKVTLR